MVLYTRGCDTATAHSIHKFGLPDYVMASLEAFSRRHYRPQDFIFGSLLISIRLERKTPIPVTGVIFIP